MVETNSFRLNTIPTLDTKQIYLNKIMKCKNDREFLNDLIEFYFNYETKGHFNIVDVDSYHRIHQVYKNLIQDKRISKNNWKIQCENIKNVMLPKEMTKKVRGSIVLQDLFWAGLENVR